MKINKIKTSEFVSFKFEIPIKSSIAFDRKQ